MSLVFEKMAQSLGAGQRWQLNIAGDFFRLSAAAYPVSVSLLKNQRVIGTMEKLLAGDYVNGVEFDGVVVDNGATAQDVTLQIAGGGAGSDRVLGEVSVIDGGRARTAADMAFWGGTLQAPSAGNYPHIQLINPAASGKNVVLEAVSVASGTAGMISFGHYSTALTTAVGTLKSKKVGSAVLSEALMKTQLNASALASYVYGNVSIQANQSQAISLREPLILEQGRGVVIYHNSIGADLSASFEIFEESI